MISSFDHRAIGEIKSITLFEENAALFYWCRTRGSMVRGRIGHSFCVIGSFDLIELIAQLF